MIATARKILAILTPRERRRGSMVIVMMAALAVIEVAGIASITPFLAVLGNPGVVEQNPYLNGIYQWLGFGSPETFLIALGVFAVIFLMTAAVFRTLAHHAMFRFANMRRHAVSRRLLAGHLRQPYEFFLSRNTADLAKTILSEVDQLTNHVVRPVIEIFAYGFAALAVIALLVAVDPLLALIVGGVLGGSYGLFYLAVRGVLGRLGRDRVSANRQRFKAAAEALGGIKELKVLGRERAFFNAFDPASARFASHHATSQILGQVPKHLIEAVGFAAIIIVALYILGSGANLGQALPIIGLYALAGYRLLPALQHVYGALTKLRFGVSALDAVLSEMNSSASRLPMNPGGQPPLPLQSCLELRGVTYAYPSFGRPALRNIGFSIQAHTSLGIIGKTGAGKSTLVDIMLGLLTPQAGALHVDGRALRAEDLPAWQRNIGYVPQHIFLVDDTITHNIALGVPEQEIDLEAVKRAARSAQIHAFVEEELPAGYDTVVGEHGVRLSGGQRQRLGMARALYHDPEVLLLDEATSALDQATEAAVMETISAFQGRKTIILIAHRLSTVRRCDHLLRLDKGEAVAFGSYAEVVGAAKESRQTLSRDALGNHNAELIDNR
ncbi:MAG: ATP-binding cassette domain-containing protein [Aquisalimonadaceae bacterium]